MHVDARSAPFGPCSGSIVKTLHCLSVLLFGLSHLSSAQLLANDTLEVASYNGSSNFAAAAGVQRNVYSGATTGHGTITNIIMVRARICYT